MTHKISALLCLMLSILLPTQQVHAQVLTLESAMQALRFSLEVEWDHKNQEAKEKYYQKFFNDVSQLKKKGMSNDQILKELSCLTKDDQLSKDLKRIIEISKTRHLTEKQTAKLVKDYTEKSKKEGASWVGESTWVTVGIIAFVILIVVAIATAKTCEELYPNDYEAYLSCESDDFDEDDGWNDDCYYDSWGDWVCY